MLWRLVARNTRQLVKGEWEVVWQVSNTVRFERVVLSVIVVAVAGCSAVDPTELGDAESVEEPVDVQCYCTSFANAYTTEEGSAVVADTVRVKNMPMIGVWISNVFQPRGSRFVSSYRCTFAMVSPDREGETVAVGIVLASTRNSLSIRSGKTCRSFRSVEWQTRRTTVQDTASSSTWRETEHSTRWVGGSHGGLPWLCRDGCDLFAFRWRPTGNSFRVQDCCEDRQGLSGREI